MQRPSKRPQLAVAGNLRAHKEGDASTGATCKDTATTRRWQRSYDLYASASTERFITEWKMPVNRSTLFQDEKEAMRLKAQQVWRSADAVCFDVDSTVIREEGIDKLAGIAGVGKEVSEM